MAPRLGSVAAGLGGSESVYSTDGISESVTSLRQERDEALQALEKQKENAEKIRVMYKDLSNMYMKLRMDYCKLQKQAKDGNAKMSEDLARETREKQDLQWQLNDACAEVERVRSRASYEIAQMVRSSPGEVNDPDARRSQLADALEDLAVLRQERADLLKRAKEERDIAKAEAAEEVKELKAELESLRLDRAFLMRKIVKAGTDLDRARDDAQRHRAVSRDLQKKIPADIESTEVSEKISELTKENRRLSSAMRAQREEAEEEARKLKQELRARSENFNEERSSLQSDLEESYQTLERSQRTEQILQTRVSLLQRALADFSERFSGKNGFQPDSLLDQLVRSKVQLAELQEENVVLKGRLCRVDTSPADSSSGSEGGSPTRMSRTFTKSFFEHR